MKSKSATAAGRAGEHRKIRFKATVRGVTIWRTELSETDIMRMLAAGASKRASRANTDAAFLPSPSGAE
jgi:hypothetical protein